MIFVSSEIPLFTPEEPFGGCLYNPHSPMGLRVLHGTVGVYLPMAMVGAVYVAVFVKVVLNTCVNGVELRGSYRRRVVISKMLFAGFGWFCLTYLPQPVLTTYFKKTYDDNPESYVCSRWALFLGAGANAVSFCEESMSDNYQLNFGRNLRWFSCFYNSVWLRCVTNSINVTLHAN